MAEPTYRERTKALMLASAERLLAEEGLSGVQARRIAKEAGCAVGTLYNIFNGGLDELIITANQRTLERLGVDLAAANGRPGDALPGDRIMALSLAYLAFAARHEKPWRAIFEHHMSPGAEVPVWYRDTQDRLFSLVETAIGNAVPDAVARSRAARALFAAVHGVVAIALDHKLGQQSAAEIEAQVRFIVTTIARGLSANAAGAG